ncbi:MULTISPECIES: Pr6Pr family membrane protein [Pedobacter]|uniref:Pr6Pr family membrane protein n=1 Tax=Pedobacter TaxID=84567 RepID=UPI00120C007F|nr:MULTISPECIES: Pr6Pr family membrane protein [Pedobacter]RZL22319.1 MAG: hypothetical protein EOO96_23975 [Pedobacter sp.]
MKSSPATKIYIAIGTAIVWFALVLQFIVSLKAANYDFWTTTKLYLSFFTVTTNILLGICFGSVLLLSNHRIGKFFTKSSTITALTVYILVVGLIYNVLLRGLVLPVGWARVADEMLHVVTPVIFLVFWILFVDKSNLQYKDAFSWLIYPMAYIIFVVVRGYFIHEYPYPFVNVINLGYPQAILNAFFCVLLFYVLSILLIWLGKKLHKN